MAKTWSIWVSDVVLYLHTYYTAILVFSKLFLHRSLRYRQNSLSHSAILEDRLETLRSLQILLMMLEKSINLIELLSYR
jgi:hypothetical protein